MSDDYGCDLLVLAPHPDDAELGCGGLLLRASRNGARAVVVDCTRGESGTRGTPEGREQEARDASELIGLHGRENLGLPDGRIPDDDESVGVVVGAIRRHRPRFFFAPLPHDIHPDHETVASLAKKAFFLSGLRKRFPEAGEAFRPELMLRYGGNDDPSPPTLCVDITNELPDKLRAIGCFRSQVPERRADRGHYVKGLGPLERTETRDRFFGSQVGVDAAEPLWCEGPLRLDRLSRLLEVLRT